MVPHDTGPYGALAHEEASVVQLRSVVIAREESRGVLPVHVEPVGSQPIPATLEHLPPEGELAVSAVARDLGRDPVEDLAAGLWIDQRGDVAVAMDVDEPRRHHEPGRVDNFLGLVRVHLANRADLLPRDAHIRLSHRATQAVCHQSIDNGKVKPLRHPDTSSQVEWCSASSAGCGPALRRSSRLHAKKQATP